MEDNEWLKQAILSYVKDYQDKNRLNAQDIIFHFRLAIDVTYIAIYQLCEEKRLIRVDTFLNGWDGHHYYKLPKISEVSK